MCPVTNWFPVRPSDFLHWMAWRHGRVPRLRIKHSGLHNEAGRVSLRSAEQSSKAIGICSVTKHFPLRPTGFPPSDRAAACLDKTLSAYTTRQGGHCPVRRNSLRKPSGCVQRAAGSPFGRPSLRPIFLHWMARQHRRVSLRLDKAQ